jgi:hypothetical protein
MDLWTYFLQNQGRKIHKHTQLFPVYERYFTPWRNKTLNFMEIGVYQGGSLQMWQSFFGPRAKIVGVDINPQAKKFEQPGVHVRIGDQGDPVFLAALIEEFGPFDIILDDASHLMDKTMQSFEFLYPTVPKNGLYLIEDIQTSYWKDYGGGLHEAHSVINRAKRYIDDLNARESAGQVPVGDFTKETLGIHFYDNIIVFEKGHTAYRDVLFLGQ